MGACSIVCAKTSPSFSNATPPPARWEVLTCYPGLHALVCTAMVSNRLWRWGFRWLARWLSHSGAS